MYFQLLSLQVVVVAGEHNKVEFEGKSMKNFFKKIFKILFAGTEQTVDVAELIVHESYGSPKVGP